MYTAEGLKTKEGIAKAMNGANVSKVVDRTDYDIFRVTLPSEYNMSIDVEAESEEEAVKKVTQSLIERIPESP